MRTGRCGRLARLGAAAGVLAACLPPPPAPPAAARACTGYPEPRRSPYVLPYPAGRAYRLTQGNCSQGSHAAASAYRHAYDFAMPVGDTVVAARGGTVVAVEETFADGTRLAGQENEIVVRHGDGTFARSTHLSRGGALVEVGSRVRRGEPIGLSGDSGNSRGPHLHFDVARCPDPHCETLPVVFRNMLPPAGVLTAGGHYAAR